MFPHLSIPACFVALRSGGARHLLLLPLLLMLVSFELQAQLPAPTSVDLRFRIYGKDARPITGKECAITGSSMAGRGMMMGGPVQTQMRGSTLEVTYGTYDLFNSFGAFTIACGDDTMEVRSACSIDSLPFMPGSYVIPDGFNVVLDHVRAGRARIVPGWPDLRVASVDSFPPNLGVTGQPPPAYFDAEVYAYEPSDYGHGMAAANVLPGTNIIVIAVRFRDGSRHILFSSDSCRQWPTRITPPQDEGYFVGVKFVDHERGWVQLLNSERRLLYSMTTDHGRNWLTSDYPPSWARDDRSGYSPYGRELPRGCFIDSDSRTGFDSQWDYNFVCTLMGTSDGGRTWEHLFSTPSYRPGVIRFLNARVGVLLLAQSLFLTRDAGATWRFIPIAREYSAARLPYSHSEALPLFNDFFFISEEALCLCGPTAIMWMNLPPV